jgi:hypothetical protein
MPAIALVEDDRLGFVARVEAIVWGVTSRVGLRLLGLRRLLWVLDRVPRRRRNRESVAVPPAAQFRGAGACLSRSIARSQFIRQRRGASSVVLGIDGSLAKFDAHAWLEPLDKADRPALHRIDR